MNITETMASIYALFDKHLPQGVGNGPMAEKYIEPKRVRITNEIIHECHRLNRLGIQGQIIADRLGISKASVSNILAGKTVTSKGVAGSGGIGQIGRATKGRGIRDGEAH